MEIFLIKALQLILCFALLVVLHEAGHFFFAKLFNIRVEKFCIFFDPKFSLKLFSYKGTDYHIGWIPLGGYVKISGMIDESMDTEQMKQPVKDYEFRAKPAWQRLLVMIGGVLFNLITAVVIYIAMLYTWGETYIPVKNYTHGFTYNALAKEAGFVDGDIPLRTDIATFDRIDSDFYRNICESRNITVLRQGTEVTFDLPESLTLLQVADTKTIPPFIAPTRPSVIDSVTAGSPAQIAGIKKGDQLLSIDDFKFTTWNKFALEMSRRNDILATGNAEDSLRLSHITITVARANSQTIDTLQVKFNSDYQFGFYMRNAAIDYETVTRQYSFFESIPAGIDRAVNTLTGYVSDLKYVFTAEGASSIGSFGTIGNLFPATWDWQRFWSLTAFISLILAVMNILPIPALDGGHVFFLLVEIILRRKPSDAFMERAQMFGMILLFGLMALALFNDCSNFGVFDIFK